MKRVARLLVTVCATAFLAACGGGGGNGSSSTTGGSSSNSPGSVSPSTNATVYPPTVMSSFRPVATLEVGPFVYIMSTGLERLEKSTKALVTVVSSPSANGFGYGMASVGSNLYYIGQGDIIRQVSLSDYSTSILAGGGTAGDGVGTAASFNGLNSITSDGTNLFTTEYPGCKVRKISPITAQVTTLAGNGTCQNIDGTGAAAEIYPSGSLATDGTNLYSTAQYGTTVTGIRQISIATGAITTLPFSSTSVGGIAYANGTIYYGSVDYHVYKTVMLTGQKTVFAGGPPASMSATTTLDGIGANATFFQPTGLSAGTGVLYVRDELDKAVRQVNLTTAAVTTVAGLRANNNSSTSTGGTGLLGTWCANTSGNSECWVFDTNSASGSTTGSFYQQSINQYSGTLTDTMTWSTSAGSLTYQFTYAAQTNSSSNTSFPVSQPAYTFPYTISGTTVGSIFAFQGINFIKQ